MVKPNGSGRPSRPADNRIIREEETLAWKNRKGQVKTAEERVTPVGNRSTKERRLPEANGFVRLAYEYGYPIASALSDVKLRELYSSSMKENREDREATRVRKIIGCGCAYYRMRIRSDSQRRTNPFFITHVRSVQRRQKSTRFPGA